MLSMDATGQGIDAPRLSHCPRSNGNFHQKKRCVLMSGWCQAQGLPSSRAAVQVTDILPAVLRSRKSTTADRLP